MNSRWVDLLWAASLVALLALAALAPADARADKGIAMPDGEVCVLPGPHYLHVGISTAPTSNGATSTPRPSGDRYTWWWCTTRFELRWSYWLEPAATASAVEVDTSAAAQAVSSVGFLLRMRSIPEAVDTSSLRSVVTALVAADTDRPPEPRWQVGKNGAAKDRPAYTVDAAGKRVTKSTMRATVGDACSCAGPVGARLIEGSTVYCNTPLASGEAGPKLAVCTPAPDAAPSPSLSPTPTPSTQPVSMAGKMASAQ